MSSRSPLDRAALERVLARAAELQAQEVDAGASGALSDEQILDLGKEVGLTPDGLRRAIAEERGRVSVPVPPGVGGTWFGVPVLSAARVLPMGAPAALDALDAAMRGDLPFDVKRRFPDGMQWEPRRSFLDMMRSQLARPAEGADLRLAEDVGASVIAIDAQRTHVRLDARLVAARGQATMRSGGALVGAAGVSVLAVTLGFAAIVVVPIAGALGIGGLFLERQRYRQRTFRVATALEQLLDRLEFGPPKKQGRNIVDKLLG